MVTDVIIPYMVNQKIEKKSMMYAIYFDHHTYFSSETDQIICNNYTLFLFFLSNILLKISQMFIQILMFFKLK